MFVNAQSGQHIGFAMISALSGTSLTKLSGLISGYKTTGSGLQMGVSGNIVEIGFGQYWCNLYDWDCSGGIISYLFTGASGAIPVEKTVITTLNTSGQEYPASGINTTVPPASISGVYVASGLYPASGVNVTASLASGTVYLASGTPLFYSGLYFVGSGSISSTPPASGTVYLASGSSLFWSGLLYPASGSVYPASGSITSGVISSGVYVTATAVIASGALSGQQVTLVSGQSYIASGIWSASGASVVTTVSSGTTYLASGSPLFWSGLLYPASGSVYPASGSITSGVIISGVYVNATASAPASGTIYLASGTPLFWSGLLYLSSGQNVSLYSGSLSGQQVQVTLNSGQVYIASGTAQAVVSSGTVYLASGSIFMNSFASGVVGGGSGNIPSSWGASGAVTVGQNLDKIGYGITSISSGLLSGQQVTLTSGQSFMASGINVIVPIASLSGVQPVSGATVAVPIASISGTTVNLVSGTVYPASGTSAAVASGSVYLASGSPLFWSGLIYPASGTTSAISSGTVYLASGSVFTDLMRGNMSGITGEPIHSPINALRKLTNKWDTTSTSGYLTVYKEDASTTAYTQALTSQSGAAPVTALGDS